jgi:hypothetical protein
MSYGRDPSAARSHEIVIDGETCKVWCAKDKAHWRAYGNFRGEPVDVRGTSESSALSKWIDIANYHANE